MIPNAFWIWDPVVSMLLRTPYVPHLQTFYHHPKTSFYDNADRAYSGYNRINQFLKVLSVVAHIDPAPIPTLMCISYKPRIRRLSSALVETYWLPKCRNDWSSLASSPKRKRFPFLPLQTLIRFRG